MSQGALFAFGSGVFFIGGVGIVFAGLSLFRSWEDTAGVSPPGGPASEDAGSRT